MTGGHEGVGCGRGCQGDEFIIRRIQASHIIIFYVFLFFLLCCFSCNRFIVGIVRGVLIDTLHYVVLSLLIDTMKAHDFDLSLIVVK